MSELQFSGQLVQNLLTTLVEHDERAEEDSVACQYLAGTIGFLLGREDRLETEQKAQILAELSAFSGRVIADVEQHRQPEESAAPAPQSDEADEGVWSPDQG